MMTTCSLSLSLIPQALLNQTIHSSTLLYGRQPNPRQPVTINPP
jgi:hypothetical protein